MRLTRRLAAAAAAVAMAAAPVLGSANQQGLDWYSTDNVKFIQNLRTVADGVGARVVGNYMYVTSSKGLYIFDITDPPNPKQVGNLTVQVHWENEEVPTNGKILGLSSSDGCSAVTSTSGTPDPTKKADCLSLYDVTDKTNPKLITSVWSAGPHTSSCVLDCQYMWGSDGTIVDLRHVLEAGHPAPIIGNWLSGSPAGSAHHQTEVRPGVVLTATNPIMLMSVNAEDGGTPAKPKLLATGSPGDTRFIHSVRWPNLAADPIMLAGGETNFNERCTQTPGAFMTFDASQVQDTRQFKKIDEYTVTTGAYSDGNPAVTVLGCSVHWFEAHRTFNGGGLVAVAAYDSGTRFLKIDPSGKIHEVGWFEPVAGGTSAPHWAPDGKTLYAIDYQRGIDVLQWTGPTYAPQTGSQGTTAAPVPPATGGSTPLPLTVPGPPAGWLVVVMLGLAVGGAGRLAWRHR
jgi:hypothetical protein